MSRLLSLNNTDFCQVTFNGSSDVSRKTGNVGTFAEVTSIGVIDALELFHKEDRSRIMTEHGRNQTGHCNNPAEVLKVLGVDEHFVGMTATVFFNDIVDCNVKRICCQRSFDLVGCSFQFFGTAHGQLPFRPS